MRICHLSGLTPRRNARGRTSRALFTFACPCALSAQRERAVEAALCALSRDGDESSSAPFRLGGSEHVVGAVHLERTEQRRERVAPGEARRHLDAGDELRAVICENGCPPLLTGRTTIAGTDCLCTSTPITIIRLASELPLGATGERTDLNRGGSHAPIRSPSMVSVGGGDTTLDGQTTHGTTFAIESAAANRVCASNRTLPLHRE